MTGTGPSEGVHAELERVLEVDGSRLGDVYRGTREGLSAHQIADQLEVDTSGFVSNYRTILAAMLDGVVPTKPAIAGQVAAKVRTVLRVSSLSAETRDYLTGILAQLEPVVAPRGQAVQAQPKPESADRALGAGTLRRRVEDELRRRVRALAEVISTEIGLEADDYAAVRSAPSPMDELARVVMLQSAGRTFVSLSKAGRLDLTLESGAIAWSEDVARRCVQRGEREARLLRRGSCQMTEAVERMLPLYEAKMIHHYDHRWATYKPDGSTRDVTLEEKQDPDFVVMPRYWIREEVVEDKLVGDLHRTSRLLGVRDICRSTDERTVIASLFPVAAVGNNLPIVVGGTSPARMTAVLSSFALDFLARPKVGSVHLNFFIANQLPVLSPDEFDVRPAWLECSLGGWVDLRVEWLCSAFGWADPTERAAVRGEIDALMFHLYGIERDDVDYIMETFPIVKRKDIAAHGEFRTKRMILDIYAQMAEAIKTGTPYESPFNAYDVEDS